MKYPKPFLSGATLLTACCLVMLTVAALGCARQSNEPGPQPLNQDPTPLEGSQLNPPADETRQTSFYIEMDEEGASAFYTVVQPGQIVIFRSVSGNKLEIKYDDGAFVDQPNPLILPADGTPIKVEVNPDAQHGDSYNTMVVGETDGHGSPTLIVRTGPIGTDSF